MNTLILPAFNFLLLLGFIFYKTNKPFKQYMKTRASEVFDGLNRSKLQAAEAANRKKDVEAKLLALDSERANIAADWKQKEAAQTAAIRDSSARVIAQMKKEAEQNKKSFEMSLHADILKTFRKNVLAQAETKIKAALSADVQNKMNQKFIQKVGEA